MADTLTIIDNRTGRQYEIPVVDDTIRALDLRQIRVDPGDFGMMSYDPAFLNTASCRSAVTFIDGEKGILRYRGYPIEQLAEQSTFVETAYLLVNGELPTATRLADWQDELSQHVMLHESVKKFVEGFRYDAHPMGIFLSTVGALSTFYPRRQGRSTTRPLGGSTNAPTHCEGAEHRRLRVPPQRGSSRTCIRIMSLATPAAS